jgi:hypothetical protein
VQVRLAAAALAACAVVALARPADATPAQDLDEARELFRGGHFADALPLINLLLYPTPRLSQTEDLVEAYVLLGACAFETGDRKRARREFEEALSLERNLVIEPPLYSADAVEFFDDVRADLAEKEARDAEARRLAIENERLAQALENLVVIETRPFYVNFIPFGAGQFQNGDRRKGLFFATSQAVTGALSAGIWLYLVGEFGFPGRVEPERAEQALRLQQIEIGAGAVCLGLMAWGIVDSLLHYKPSVRVAADPSMLPDEIKKRKAADPETSLRLQPFILPDPEAPAAGLSLTWEH